MSDRLHPDDIEAIAVRVVELVRPAEYLPVDEFCRRFSVARSTAYAHADELGAVRVGNVLRFPARLAPSPVAAAEPAVQPRGPRRRLASKVKLLPVGRAA